MIKDVVKIKKISPKDNQDIYIEYEDGTKGIINLKPSNKDSIFNRFLNYDYFMNARIDKKYNTIVRDEDIDIDGYSCYLQILNNDKNGTDK